MNKEFWAQTLSNNFEFPAEYTLADLTSELFAYLGSTDPELRDEIGYVVYANWLKQERYSASEIRQHVKGLLANLDRGIGETDGDSVFLRSFSALFLAEIVHNDNKRGFFEKADIEAILEKGLAYLAAEKDLRGYVPVKGWAHALAHVADLMFVLAKNRFIGAQELTRILRSIADKVFHSADSYLHGEDERLANAIAQTLRRNLLPTEEVRHWAVSFVGENWHGAYADEARNRAFQNTRNLLRSIYLELRNDENEMERREEYEAIFLETLNSLKSF